MTAPEASEAPSEPSAGPADPLGALRPLERRVQRLIEAGVSEAEIAWRFRRSPGFIRQVRHLTTLPRSAAARVPHVDGLRPLERRVLAWRDGGASYVEIASRFRRSPSALRRVELLARHKLSGSR